jgi:N-methylhydantoinase A
VGVTDKIELKSRKKAGEDPTDALIKTKDVVFGGEVEETPLYDREKLKPGNRVEGPAVIMEYSSTTVVPPDHIADVNEYQGVEIRRLD